MERRRRALGLKRPGASTPEKNASNPSIQMSTFNEHSKSKPKSEDKVPTRGKSSVKNQLSASVTPKQKTVFSPRNVTPRKPESPCSPLQSPGSQMIFPLASPEIEVSWDWSCSQVPKDMLPPKKVKRVKDVKMQVPDLPTLNLRPRPRPPQQRQITEEENQQRLEYYKNILSLKPLESTSEVLSDSTNNNLKDVPSDALISVTPKRPTTRLSSASKRKDENNSLFDDSANEFMFECSQAIEEKLKSGDIDMGPIVDIKIPQTKRAHSPGVNTINLHKKTCHGRVNLFPEKINSSESEDKNQFGLVLPRQPVITNKASYHSNPNSESYNGKVEDQLKSTTLSRPTADFVKPSVSKTHSNKSLFNNNKVNTFMPNNNYNTNSSNQKALINKDCQTVERKPLLTKTAHCVRNPASDNHIIKQQNICAERFQKTVNISNQNSVDRLNKPQSVNNKSAIEPLAHNNKTSYNHQNVRREINQLKEIKRPEDVRTTQDVKSLLDDDFDLELSCLDVDSLCQRSEEPQIPCVASTAPKLCTQQEIEAKRLAALQKLMKKKKR